MLDYALEDMRHGARVMLILPSDRAIDAAIFEARTKAEAGERVRRRHPRIDRSLGGSIVLSIYSRFSVSGRGLTLDRIYVDHSELYLQLAPCMATSTAVRNPRFVHGPELD